MTGVAGVLDTLQDVIICSIEVGIPSLIADRGLFVHATAFGILPFILLSLS